MWFLFVVAVLLVAAYFLFPTPVIPSSQAAKASLDDFTFPTNSNARVIPEVFGTVHLHGNIIGTWDLNAVEITQSQEVKTGLFSSKTVTQIVGYSYFLSMAYAFCSWVDELKEFRVDGHTMASFSLTGDGTFQSATGKIAEVYGSSQPQTTIRAYLGSQTSADSMITAKTGYAIAHKGVTYIVLDNAFIGDNVRACPMYSMVAKRTNINGAGWTNYDINGDANPAHVIYYIFYNMFKVPATLLDDTAFKACGDTLNTEGFGVSFVMSSEQEAQNWVKEILRHIDGLVYFDPVSGKYTMKLIRDDYDLESCQAIDESNSKNVNLSRRGWEDTVSHITVKYTNRDTFSEDAVSDHNIAARLCLGYKRAETLNFMACTSGANARALLARLIKKQSYPLATVKFTVSSDEMILLPGQVVKFSNANTSPAVANMPLRIMNLTGSRESDQDVEVEALEDIFGIGSMQLLNTQGNLAIDWDYDIQPFSRYKIIDARQEMAQVSAIVAAPVAPSGMVFGMRLYIDGEYVAHIPKWSYAVISGTYGVTSELDESATGMTVIQAEQVEELSQTREQFQKMHRVALVEDEIIVFQNCVYLGGNAFRLTNIMRGQYGTSIAAHSNPAQVFMSTFPAASIIAGNASIIPVTGHIEAFNTMDIAVQAFSHSYGYTVETPYPPFNVSGYRDGNNIHVEWRTATRLAGANYRAVDSFQANEDPIEGEWEVSAAGISTFTTASGGFDRVDATGRTYTIKSKMGGYYSAGLDYYI